MAISLTQRRRTLIVIATLLGTFLSALDVTVVGTAMPTIIGSLGGISRYSWVFSAYLLTSTATVPIYGKLADLYGRKPVFVITALVFLIGSALCGFSRSVEQLIAFRAIQGLGAGALIPVTMTIFGDLFALEERARMQGLVSAVWGVSSVIGPAVGGIIVDYYGWPWVFYVNLPLGLASIVLLSFALQESIDHRQKPQIDYVGATLLTVGVVLFLFALVEGGVSVPWDSPAIFALIGIAVVALAAFVAHEQRIDEPIIPLSLFTSNRIIWSSYGASFLVSMAMMGVSSYVPLFAQGAMGGTAMVAGAVLAPMSIGWPIAGAVSGHLILRFGFKQVARLGTLFVLFGAFMLTALRVDSSQAFAIAATFTIGLGLGFSMTSYLLAVQNAVRWSERGVATSVSQFFRMIGNAVGVAISGTILNVQMMRHLAASLGQAQTSAIGLSQANVLLDPTARASLDGATLFALRAALADSLHMVFWSIVGFALLSVLATSLLPGGSAKEYSVEP